MNILDIDLLEHRICLFARYEDILTYGMTCRRGRELVRRTFFWQHKAKREFKLPTKIFNMTFFPPSLRYLQILATYGGIAPGAERFLSHDNFICHAIDNHREDLIQYLCQKYRDTNYNFIASRYLLEGDFDKMEEYKFSSSGLKSQLSKHDLMVAICENRLEVVKYLIIDLHFSITPRTMIETSILSANLDIIMFVLQHYSHDLDWAEILRETILSCDPHIFEMIFIEFTKSREIVDWNDIYYYAYKSGTITYVLYIKAKIGLVHPSPDRELYAAIWSGNINFVKYVIDSHPGFNFDYPAVMSAATEFGDQEMLKFVLSKFQQDDAFWINFLDNLLLDENPLALIRIIPRPIVERFRETFLRFIYEQIDDDPYTMFKHLIYLGPEGVDWDLILEKLLPYQDKRYIDMTLKLADEYEFDREELLDHAKRLGSYVYEYLEERI